MNEQHETINAQIGSTDPQALVEMASNIVAAYVSHNTVRPEDMPNLMQTVFASISQIAAGQIEAAPEAPPVPAISIKKSITEDHLICLEDGKKFRSLKRHLGTVYGMSPDDYRKKWGLPNDYPMTAPGYSAVRSQLAKQIGLGQQTATRRASAEA